VHRSLETQRVMMILSSKPHRSKDKGCHRRAGASPAAEPMRLWVLLLVIVVGTALCGCHSACFQTAKIRQGGTAYVGSLKLEDSATPGFSDYSVFIKGEIGRSATAKQFGYSFAMTFVSPLKKDHRELFHTSGEIDADLFPNEYATVFPEAKIQAPRVLPVDMALGGRLSAVFPDRATVFVSRDVGQRITLYSAYSLDIMGHLLHSGMEISLTDRLSAFLEYSTWLSEHDYPSDYSGSSPARPKSIGVCFCYAAARRDD
jgi:hypothetical protein